MKDEHGQKPQFLFSRFSMHAFWYAAMSLFQTTMKILLPISQEQSDDTEFHLEDNFQWDQQVVDQIICIDARPYVLQKKIKSIHDKQIPTDI